MAHGTIILFNISFVKLLELSPSWGLNVTEILESLICMPKSKCQLRPTGKSCCLSSLNRVCKYVFLRILNLEVQQNCMIGLQVTTIISIFIQKTQNLIQRHVGCLSKVNKLEYCAAH